MAAEELLQFFKTANKVGTWEERRANMESLENLPMNIRREVINKYYEDWLEDGYEEDYSSNGYVGYINLAIEMSEWFPDKSKRILDCASGNGFLGEELQKRGFTNIDACDSSQGSLDFSRSKNIYKNFICAVLGPDRLPIDDDTYDGICLTGGFGSGHVQPDCLPEWRRITKPGGLLMFLVREESLIRSEGFCDGVLDSIIHNMAGKGSWEFLEKKRLLYIKQVKNDEVILLEYAYMYVLRVV